MRAGECVISQGYIVDIYYEFCCPLPVNENNCNYFVLFLFLQAHKGDSLVLFKKSNKTFRVNRKEDSRFTFYSRQFDMITILDAIKKWSIDQPNKEVWSFLNDKCEVSDCYTYKVINFFSYCGNVF